ncbi:TPA: DNA topology modulation protein [Legionella pneumophila]|jgi:adenylate kinase family enzyme|uniref:DNA topology modulation protein n=1 Tax=Legionella anisa TaxID=28082 RepID=UPI0003496E7A|nr:DNA topology modulation protein [Legionella anisa]AWN75953.1 DNA topology modulation protein [Legionella anisa]MCW8426765.1 DNA topology modulation protein [Legionella anisa]MCW8449422.1 DNA topology modulation protein [Legionella anisa]
MINLQRIMIIGRPGSGKSTFSVVLQKSLNIPLFHLDKYFFIADWVPREYEDFLSLQKKLVAKPCWIIDGNSSKSFEIRYQEADMCLYFNLPKWLCYWRVFKRLFYKASEIDDRAAGCNETVRWSLLSYMWNYEQRINPLLNVLKNQYPKVKFIELRSSYDVAHLMRVLKHKEEYSIVTGF